MKKILSLLLGITLVLTLVGCHKDKTTTKQTTTESKPTTTEPKPTTTEQKTTTEPKEYYNGRISKLVVDNEVIFTCRLFENEVFEGRQFNCLKIGDQVDDILLTNILEYEMYNSQDGYFIYEYSAGFYNEETKTLLKAYIKYHFNIIVPEGETNTCNYIYTLVDYESNITKTTFTENQKIEFIIPNNLYNLSEENDFYRIKNLMDTNWVKPEN